MIATNRISLNGKIRYASQIPFTCATWLEIGYNCFVILPYYDEHEHQAVRKINDLILEWLVKQNTEIRKKTVILNLKVPESRKDDVVMLAQVARLFAAHLVKYSVHKSDYENVQNAYFMTTDVDLYPLSARLYHDFDHDWNLVNIIRYAHDGSDKSLYVALSCIGSTGVDIFL